MNLIVEMTVVVGEEKGFERECRCSWWGDEVESVGKGGNESRGRCQEVGKEGAWLDVACRSAERAQCSVQDRKEGRAG